MTDDEEAVFRELTTRLLTDDRNFALRTSAAPLMTPRVAVPPRPAPRAPRLRPDPVFLLVCAVVAGIALVIATALLG